MFKKMNVKVLMTIFASVFILTGFHSSVLASSNTSYDPTDPDVIEDAISTLSTAYINNVIEDTEEWEYFDENDKLPKPDSCIKDLNVDSTEETETGIYNFYMLEDPTEEKTTEVMQAYSTVLLVDCEDLKITTGSSEYLYDVMDETTDELVAIFALGVDDDGPDEEYYLMLYVSK